MGKTGSGNLAQGQTRRGSEHRSSWLQSPLQCPSPGQRTLVTAHLLRVIHPLTQLYLCDGCLSFSGELQESGTPG